MKKILAILLALSLLLALPACGGKAASDSADTPAPSAEPTPEPAPEPTPEPTPEPVSPAGGYKLTDITGGSGNNLKIVSAVVDLGVKYYLFLHEDGTGSMNFLEAEIPLVWDESSITLQARDESAPGPVTVPYTCADGSLNMSTRAYSMDFRALTGEELADYEAKGSGSLGGMVGALVRNLIAGMDGGPVSGLLFDLALGTTGDSWEPEPIPEGDPSAGPVTGVVDGLEFTVLGAELLEDGGDSYLLFHFNATNLSDDLRGPGAATFDASQDGEILWETWDLDDRIPEHYNLNYKLYPGRTIRCVCVYPINPDGGTVGFRISSYDDAGSVFYYADLKNLSGAPEEPFVFDDGYTIPTELKELPEETAHARLESVEFYTAEDGSPAVHFNFRYLNRSSEDGKYHNVTALQDGITLPWIYSEIDFGADEEELAEDRIRTLPCRLRTESPVVFLVLEETDEGADLIELAKIVEVG